MIIGIGSDLTGIQRIGADIDRHGDRFLHRVFTEAEIALSQSRSEDSRVATYAKRFAAKEACAKALGTGFRDGLILKDIEVTNDEWGRPLLSVTGEAAERLKALTPPGKTAAIHVSLTDEGNHAQAFVVIEAL
ncbi:MAG: holo-ACP synthase [Rhodospirillales bacterium]|nr:holo-ACP synthase [Rhodospirillales bacterium]